MLWKKKKQRSLPTRPTEYPSGTCVQTETGWFYIKQNSKLSIKTTRILDSWAFGRIVQTTDAAIKHYKVARPLGFRTGSLIKSWEDGKLYIIVDNKKRPVVSPDFLHKMQITEDDFVEVSKEEAKLHENGEEIQ